LRSDFAYDLISCLLEMTSASLPMWFFILLPTSAAFLRVLAGRLSGCSSWCSITFSFGMVRSLWQFWGRLARSRSDSRKSLPYASVALLDLRFRLSLSSIFSGTR
jgi:hypothetical protein